MAMMSNPSIGRATVAMVAAVLFFASLLAVGSPAQAVTNQDGTSSFTNDFFAYVKAGERIQVSSPDAQSIVVLNENRAPVELSGGYTPTASSAGVWRVTIYQKTTTMYGFTYAMSVRDGTTEKKGRIWVETDRITQGRYSDLNYYGVSDLGYIYEIKIHRGRGYVSNISLRSAGASQDRECTTIENRSFEGGAYLDCGDKYRLFFEDPRQGDLPAEAKMGKWTIPVLPALVTSAQLKTSTAVTFAPNHDKVGGAFTVASHPGFSGTADVQVDTNSNGSYRDAVDVIQTVAVNKGVSRPWVWDGKDGTGADVSVGAKARVAISKGGEAHLFMSDYEELDGLTMTRLNGESPDSAIRWDDSALLKPRGGSPTPVKVCLTGCNSAVGGGVHGWDRGVSVEGTEASSWGDGRTIDNWAYASVNAVSPTISLPALRTLTFDATGGTITGAAAIKRTNGLAWGALPTANAPAKVFLGWHTAKAGGKPVTPSTLATGTIKAYAQWRPAKFNVVFYPNAQMGTVTGSTTSASFDSGCTDCRLPANGFTKTTGAPELIDHDNESAEVNSTFLGWSLDPNSRTGDIADRAVAGAFSQTDGATVKLYAIWDDAPRFIIGAYPDRLFTLTQATSGVITEQALLATVKASDKETTPLATKTRAQVLSSGSDVGITLHDYDASDFTSLTDTGIVTVTYKVKDEAKNVAFLRIRVTVTDDSPLAPTSTQYLRGVSPEYASKGAEAGGFPADSLWLSDPARQAALNQALTNGSPLNYCLDAEAVNVLRAQAIDGLGNVATTDGLAAAVGILNGSRACS